MAEVVTSKVINCSQLSAELGGVALKVIGPDLAGNRRVSASVLLATLQAAIASHVAGPVVNDTSLADNAVNLAVKASLALTANATEINNAPNRQTGITNAKTAITTVRTTAGTKKTTAAITTVAQAQAEVRLIYGHLETYGLQLEALCNLLGTMNDLDTAGMKQSNTLIRTALGDFTSTTGT